MKKRVFLWVFTGLIIIIGFVPYKFPAAFDPQSVNNVILVSHAECTCCGDFQILKGTLSVPKQLQNQLRRPFYEINVIRKNSPFDEVTDENFVTTLYNNQFLLSGKIVGVDTYCNENIPIIKVDKWSPIGYRPVFLTSGGNYLFGYLALSGTLLIGSLIWTIIKRKAR